MRSTPRMAQRAWWLAPLAISIIIGLVLIPSIRRKIQIGLNGTVSRWTWLSNITSTKNNTTTDLQSLRKINESLIKQVASLQEQLNNFQSAQNLSKFLTNRTFHTVTAPVIATSDDPGVASMVIGAGASDGVRVGQPVITDQGFFIGQIQRTQSHMASVLMITDSQSQTIVSINNGQAAPGLLKGEHGLSARVELIPKTEQISTGQLISTSGSEAGIPPGLTIGTINNVSQNSGDLFQTASVYLSSSLLSLLNVSVITNP
jgi:rod shape-determining protein MreC